jgi:hypothetical protein
MSSAELAAYLCRHCGRTFDDGRRLGGHVRQAHPPQKIPAAVPTPGAPALVGDGEIAVRVLELWKSGVQPLEIVTSLRVHPRFVKEVLKEYDELLSEWKKFKEA